MGYWGFKVKKWHEKIAFDFSSNFLGFSNLQILDWDVTSWLVVLTQTS